MKTLGPERMLRSQAKDNSLVKNVVDNPETAESYKPSKQSLKTLSPFGDSGPYDYIIITSEALQNSFQPLINHKIQVMESWISPMLY